MQHYAHIRKLFLQEKFPYSLQRPTFEICVSVLLAILRSNIKDSGSQPF